MWLNKSGNRRGWQLRGEHKIVLVGERCPAWKGDNVKNVDAGRKRARKLFDLSLCNKCGKSGIDRHHKDGNPLNNTPENVEILCRRCHMDADGRIKTLEALWEHNRTKPKTPPSPCVICRTPYKPLRKGRCHNCNMYLRKYGIERSIIFKANPVTWDMRNDG